MALTRRQAEILGTLLLAERGLTAEELTHDVYGARGKAVTLRAEMSRLRRTLTGLLQGRPYAFALPVTSDLAHAEAVMEAGRLPEALRLAGQRVLPGSHAPRIVEARQRFEHGLRTAVERSGDPPLLQRWRDSAAGQADE